MKVWVVVWFDSAVALMEGDLPLTIGSGLFAYEAAVEVQKHAP